MAFLPFANKEKLHSIDYSFSKFQLKEIIKTFNIQLIVPGAEKFLYEGVADWCLEWKAPCFGPTMAAAMLEKSKALLKKDHGRCWNSHRPL